MINKNRKSEQFNPEEIIKKTPKKKRSLASKRVIHEEAKRIRDEENAQIAKMLEMLEEQGKLIRELIKKDEEVHEEIEEESNVGMGAPSNYDDEIEGLASDVYSEDDDYLDSDVVDFFSEWGFEPDSPNDGVTYDEWTDWLFNKQPPIEDIVKMRKELEERDLI